MNFEPTTEQKILRESVARFVAKNCPLSDVRRWDRDGELPESVHRAMAEAGYPAMMVPEAYGGLGSPMSDCAIVYEELARPSVDFATRLALISWGSMILADFASEELKQEILPRVVSGDVKLSFSLTEPSSGSDAASLQTRARKDGDDWVLTGQKLFSSGSDAKDNMIIVATRTDPSAPKHRGISLFLVPNDAPNLTIRRLDTVGRKIVGLNEIFFDEVRVPQRYLIGEVNQGWKYVTRHLERERITLAANYLGSATSAVNDAVAYAREREQFGQPIGSFQSIAHMLADMATELEAARWMTAMAAWRYDQKLPCAKEASMAKLFVSEMLGRVTTMGMQILGGHAYTTDHDMQRHWRDARNATVGGGTSQVQRSLIAREIGL
ncbi:acyl-CoA dehydrogenase family protein [Cupriavidus sp. IK-TO18]|uniref:acyl-CoA dehydrogenase family protein n=1 Tax=Cupriavidus sp. IK-TO18 TaxID=2782182 RepID=UPI00189BE824|nr:acyl-CoA dehydrogenase family protein [Cupriavidus sp. IK-TO18]MBF6990809.1 acyl-CoA dehydrogenase family protein [Cupriavidus sp. IK-TO18]